MIELSKNFVALNMAKFIYEEQVKAGQVDTKQDIKEYIFELYEECVVVVDENDASGFEFEEFEEIEIDENEGLAGAGDDLN